MATYANGTKATGKRHSQQDWQGQYRQNQTWDQHFQKPLSWDAQGQQQQGYKVKGYSSPAWQNQPKHRYHYQSTQPTSGVRKSKGHQGQGSPSHHQQEAEVPSPPTPLALPSRRGKECIKTVFCSMCTHKGSPCDAPLCTDFQNGRCEMGSGGNTCKHGLCHCCEGNLDARHVPKPKKGKATFCAAVQEHRTGNLMTGHGFVLKNGFWDEAGSMDEDRARRRQHSAAPDRSKDPFLRKKCHHCLKNTDEKEWRKRKQAILRGRVLLMVIEGIPITGPKLDMTTWIEEDGDLATNLAQGLPDGQDGAVPVYALSSYKKQLTRDSGSIFDPLGLTPMCQKALCKHWIRGECKSQRATCKFAHCHAGSFEKQGNGVEDDTQGQLDQSDPW